MAGTCDYCGEAVQNLSSCELCNARVCPAHKKEYGCMVCGGRTQV